MRKLLVLFFLIPFTGFGQNAPEYDTTRVRKNIVIIQPFLVNSTYIPGITLKTELFTNKKKFPSFIFGLSYGNNADYAGSFGLRKYILTDKKISFLFSSNFNVGEADFKKEFLMSDVVFVKTIKSSYINIDLLAGPFIKLGKDSKFSILLGVASSLEEKK